MNAPSLVEVVRRHVRVHHLQTEETLAKVYLENFNTEDCDDNSNEYEEYESVFGSDISKLALRSTCGVGTVRMFCNVSSKSE